MKASPRTRRAGRIAVAGVVLLGLGWAASLALARARFDREAWREDYAHLKHHMEAAYANMEWVVRRDGFDLVELDRRTSDALDGAVTDRGARRAIGNFLVAFEDGHLRIESGPPRAVAWITGLWGMDDEDGASFAPEISGEEACAAMGYDDGGHGFGFDVGSLPGWTPLPDDGAFPAGTFTLPDGRRAGLLRISHFGEDRYRRACAEAWNAERAERTGVCDTTCQEAFRRRASDALVRRVGSRIEALRSAGAWILAVDVTGNGGGSEWVEPVARLFSRRPLRGARVTFVRHPHWREPIAEERAAVEAMLAAPRLSGDSRARLGEARERLIAILREIDRPCDRSPLWEGRDPGCVQTIESPSWTTGAYDWLPPDALRDVADRASLYGLFGRDVPSGVWTGRLAVVIDQGSASATEQFAATLRDGGAAVLLGERTYGAGCGYTGDGIPAVLPNSGLVIRMPDCARLRADGSNELDGIAPDVPLPWSELDAAERARALAGRLTAVGRRRR